MSILVFLRNSSIIIYILLFLIGAASGFGSFDAWWQDLWHTPLREREARKEARKYRQIRQTASENAKEALVIGMAFAGHFLWVMIGLIVLTSIVKRSAKEDK